MLPFLERVRHRCPDYVPVLQALGDTYTECGRYEEGLEVDLLLTARLPDDDTAWYNLACSYARTGQIDPALEALKKSLALGYDNYEWMRRDDDLSALRSHPEFIRLTTQASA
ncbi:MAG TPA: tetratricopeptide repeat protein [Kiritimatiellia bacterium]|mgnify:CR=1 FL=1|nr:tetratricopeptide repeat protein [Kiritimatiellia bacterium]HMO97670.1 tetratricopeptide repeat protein [Kiritimatiellia bacterium]HMP95531.1 tetratricopeptide repeat protein [Kiritimatiellia bacterium]